MTLTAETRAKLEDFVALLDRWRRVTNLISDQGFDVVWSRHIEDSVHLQRISPTSRRWLDLGAGAGFPGVVVGVLLRQERDAQVHCVESDARKCAFLRDVAGKLSLPVKVHQMRAEQVDPALTGPVDIVTARAFASVPRILELARAYLDKGAAALLPRGKSYLAEIDEIDGGRYSITTHPDPQDAAASILELRARL